MSFVKHAKASFTATGKTAERLINASGEEYNLDSLTKNGWTVLPGWSPQSNFIYVRTSAISARVNYNYDAFPSAELKKAYASFVGKPVFVNHTNDNPQRARGVVVASAYRESGSDKYIECLMEVDAVSFPKLAKEITSGSIDGVSMGTSCKWTKCSYCGNQAAVPYELCDHVVYERGRELVTVSGQKQLVYEECYGLGFFELSFVFDPADSTALFQDVYVPSTVEASLKTASRNNNRKAYQDLISAPAEVDTLRDELICEKCGADDFDGIECAWCGYFAPPEQLKDPDLELAKQTDFRQEEDEMSGLSERAAMARAFRTAAEIGQQGETEQFVETPAAQKPVVTTEQVRNKNEDTDVENIDQEFTSETEAREPDKVVDVERLSRRKRATDDDDRGAADAADDEANGKSRWDEFDENPDNFADGKALKEKDARRMTRAQRALARAQDVMAAYKEAEELEVPKPDARIDVEAPIDTTDDDAEASQYDRSDYDKNGPVPNGVKGGDGNTNFGWVDKKSSSRKRAGKTCPVCGDNGVFEKQVANGDGSADSAYEECPTCGWSDINEDTSQGLKASSRVNVKKASFSQIARLTDSYAEVGIITASNKYQKIAEFENLSASVIADRQALLDEVIASRGSAVSKQATNSVPRRTAGSRPRPSFSNAPAGNIKQAGLDALDDSVTFL